MNEHDLADHYARMRDGGYELDPPEFVKLKSWHGVLFQTHSAEHALTKLMQRSVSMGSLDDAYEEQALLSHFVLQYSKCFTSSGPGQVSLDENRVFAGDSRGLATHKRILEIRHNLAAHNGVSDLVIASIAVREESDRYLVRHLLTLAIPKNELPAFKAAVSTVSSHVVERLNKHLDSLQSKLGKLVLLDGEVSEGDNA